MMMNYSEIKKDVENIEKQTMQGLKDFQRATVEYIAKIFLEKNKDGTNKQNRILVADEVGLGKTLIAKGVIAKMAKIRLIDEKDDLFKTVYVCSNLSIAKQNLEKLNIFQKSKLSINNQEETPRLSMQHLSIIKQEINAQEHNQKYQVLSLTPDTSFRMKGKGTKKERALIGAILSRIPDLSEYKKYNRLFNFFDCNPNDVENYNRQIDELEEKTKKLQKVKRYPENVISQIPKEIIKSLVDYIENRKDCDVNFPKKVIIKLRRIFAEISVKMLEPDFVIMDEFQRFRYLIQENSINEEEQSEMSFLIKEFFNRKNTRILLLSATPYQLYSTSEEIEDDEKNNRGNHYSEFIDVMNFLHSNEQERMKFKNTWDNYTNALRHVCSETLQVLDQKRIAAENAMFKCMCRTERNSVMKNGDFIDDSSKLSSLHINELDVRAYLEISEILKFIKAKYSLPIDYIKSCPFVMSFMNGYKVKKNIEKAFQKKIVKRIHIVNKKSIWLNKKAIQNYSDIRPVNARFEYIKNLIFNKNTLFFSAAHLLWVPPSKPYYEMGGAFKNTEGFTKTLVFSAWEMVPKMIGSLLSYEAERLTIGNLKNDKAHEDKNISYTKRYVSGRLSFSIAENKPANMRLFCLLYPSVTLAKYYNPLEALNAKLSLKEIEKNIREKLRPELEKLKQNAKDDGREDTRWYYLAPVLLDGSKYQNIYDSDTNDLNSQKYINLLNDERRDYFYNSRKISLGKMPKDLEDVLVNIAIASPAVCAWRSIKNPTLAFKIAKAFLKRLDTPEATAVIDLVYRRKDNNTYVRDILNYAKEGNFQAMLDEYIHIISNGEKIENPKWIADKIIEGISLRTTTLRADTFENFKDKILYGDGEKQIRFRTHFALAFGNGEAKDNKTANRKEDIRTAFNSPMRPFVLATTSIGQEGLDFHNYCRRIIHWNLPSNPVDLEQREGRINRYKCLAIRQNVAKKYGTINFSEDVWNEMFNAAAQLEKGERQLGDSDLIPFWCFGKNQEIKIERIIPMYPLSRDIQKYERLIKILSLYRLTLGSPRQEELLEYIERKLTSEEISLLKRINLSPFSKDYF